MSAQMLDANSRGASKAKFVTTELCPERGWLAKLGCALLMWSVIIRNYPPLGE